MRDPLRLELVSTLAQSLGRRSDKDEPGSFDRLGEVGVLGQEAVAGMNRVRAGGLCGPDVLLGEEVALDLDGLVGAPRVERALIVGRRNCDRRDSGLLAGAEDPGGDLTAIRYE